jgi:hypothetical protein
MYQKQKELAIKHGSRSKLYVVEIETVRAFEVAGQRKIAGGKNAGKSHYVIENTCRKNAIIPLTDPRFPDTLYL